jgi:hypothetical protein
MRFLALAFIFLLCVSGRVRRHPFFVSMTEIEWKPTEKKFEIAVRIFTDDLEKGLAASCKCKADLGNSAKAELMEKHLQNWIAENLLLSEGKMVFRPEFIGREKEDESTWSYWEANATGFSGKLKVKNTILHAVLDKQVNLIRFRKPGYDATIELRYPDSNYEFP